MINRPWKIFYENKRGVIKHNTCSELKIVNIQANAMVSSFIVSSPNIQVQPSMGITITAAFSNPL